jgi:hypothetical protein
MNNLYAIKEPNNSLNFTTIDAREDWAIDNFMKQEQTVTRVFTKHAVPSWEVYEAMGYSVVKCNLVEQKK